jgi:hypothetical protein
MSRGTIERPLGQRPLPEAHAHAEEKNLAATRLHFFRFWLCTDNRPTASSRTSTAILCEEFAFSLILELGISFLGF